MHRNPDRDVTPRHQPDPFAQALAGTLDASLAALPLDATTALAASRARALRQRPRWASWSGAALAASLLVAALSWQNLTGHVAVEDTEVNALTMLETEPQLLEDMDMLSALGEDVSDS